ncbi:hypothetical protein CJU80_02820 [Pseudomonas fragi]|nr:hypothetical protein CJU80_02820 [Pseudomonas fragi]
MGTSNVKLTYEQNLKENLWNFIVSRLFPFFGISIAAALLAHKNIADLPVFAYVLAIFSVISTLFYMPLAAIGNIVHHQKNALTPQAIFESGLSIAVLFAAIAFAAALAVFAYLPSIRFLDSLDRDKLFYLSLIYIPAIPLLVINTFTHLFHEASGHSLPCATVKKWCTCAGCAFLMFCFVFCSKHDFVFLAVGYFLIVETALFISLACLSMRLGYRHILVKPKILADVVSMGFPIAAGVAGQKLYFYLLNGKLLSLNESLVADLSICMSIIGFLSIPVIAFAQLHSVYTSQHIVDADKIYPRGQLAAAVLMAVIAGGFYALGSGLFFIFGDRSLTFTSEGFVAICMSVLSSLYFSLTASHLRAMRDTLIPQVLINTFMLAGFIPVIYLYDFNSPSIYLFVVLQAVVTFIAAVLLQYRIRTLHKRTPSFA